jgi:hypothetical protein
MMLKISDDYAELAIRAAMHSIDQLAVGRLTGETKGS